MIEFSRQNHPAGNRTHRSMTHLFLLTYNCAKTTPSSADLSDNVKPRLPDQLPDLLVFSFQEICSLLETFYPNLVHRVLMFLSDTLLRAFQEHYQVEFYTAALAFNGGVGLIVITPFLSRISRIAYATISCGYGYSTLKGACGARISYMEDGRPAEFTFVGSHLSAGESGKNWESRNQDFVRIVREMNFMDGFSVIKPNAHCFWMGDLNYRTVDSSLENDQLILSKENGDIFWGFSESDIRFNPTYKFRIGGSEYNMTRSPSWCDRILYQSYTSEKVHEYSSIESIAHSDHKPVFLSVTVPNEGPHSLINQKGYLEDSLELNIDSIYLKATFYGKFQSFLGSLSDFTIWLLLVSTLTRRGQVCLGVLFVVLIIWAI